MRNQNRSTLKRYFSEGALPSADHFADLIDSTLNMVDEGFEKTPENGFEITLIGEYERLISFFRNIAGREMVWSISYDKDTDRLLFAKPPSAKAEAKTVAAFDARGFLGVNTGRPQYELDVAGAIACHGRIGANPYPRQQEKKQKTVPADGDWHNITDALSGCQAFEVMAGVGNKGTGKYALMQATALNTFNPKGLLFNFLRRKNRIKYNHAFYLSRGQKIKLRWFGSNDEYYLQLRTKCNYGEGIRVRYYLTQLWFDETMAESWEQTAAVGAGSTSGEA
jgi:hypothetical protein